MSATRPSTGARARGFWRAIVGWLRSLWPRARGALGGGSRLAIGGGGQHGPASSDGLPEHLSTQLAELSLREGAVRDTVTTAVEDFRHLQRVVAGPGASGDAVDDVTLLAEAEAAVASIIERAEGVQLLMDVASKRPADRAGREAAGEATLALRDTGRALAELTSAALTWASTRSSKDGARMQKCVERLASL